MPAGRTHHGPPGVVDNPAADPGDELRTHRPGNGPRPVLDPSGAARSGGKRATGFALTPAKWHRFLAPAEWWRLASMLAVIVALHLIGWITLPCLGEPAQFKPGGKAFGIGIGLTAYTLGMRHAFDADHIAAIDNTTRKLMNDGRRPLAVGFFFSLGHSTGVVALAVLLATGVKAIAGPVEDDSSTLHHYPGLIGTSVSGRLLY